GFNHPSIQAFFTPCLQIGWCLDKSYWNQGLATEGALEAIEYLKQVSDIQEIFAYTVSANTVSQKVMQKIKMSFLSDFVYDSKTYIVYHLELKDNNELIQTNNYKIQ
ncbi:MAG: GNAT family N-acetyltransferase, partial [Brevinema sp.]